MKGIIILEHDEKQNIVKKIVESKENVKVGDGYKRKIVRERTEEA